MVFRRLSDVRRLMKKDPSRLNSAIHTFGFLANPRSHPLEDQPTDHNGDQNMIETGFGVLSLGTQGHDTKKTLAKGAIKTTPSTTKSKGLLLA